jgi:hypothetical protein
MFAGKNLTRISILTVIVCALGSIGSSAVEGADGRYTYLQCDFDKASMVVGFTESPTRIVDAMFPDVELKEALISDQRISFTSDNPFHSHELYRKWKEDASVSETYSMALYINRLSGGATLHFFAEYGPKEKAACQAKATGPWCNYPPLTDTKTGSCRPVKKRF